MATILKRVDFRDVAYMGVTAGLVFAGYEVIATASLTGPGTAAMPLRTISAIVLGRGALDSHYSSVIAGLVGMAIHLLLSIAFAGLFTAAVTRIATATDGELLTTSGQLALAGIVFGTVVWLVDFYLVARLAGWTWFPGNVHHVVAFLGHAFFFGCPLGWMFGRAGGLTRQQLETRAPDKLPLFSVLLRSMPAVTTERRQASSASGDFYSTSMPWILLAITLLPFVVLFAWLVAAYCGVEYGTPPWNTHSVPPPRLY